LVMTGTFTWLFDFEKLCRTFLSWTWKGKGLASLQFALCNERKQQFKLLCGHVPFGHPRTRAGSKYGCHDEGPMASSTLRRTDGEQDKNDDFMQLVVGLLNIERVTSKGD
jgi:hypothetical protein